MKQAVIFDLDGTLLDSSEDDEAIYKRAIEEVIGRVQFREELGAYNDVTDTGILLQTLADNAIRADNEAIADVKARFFELMREFVANSGPFKEIPGARSIVARLRQSPRHFVAIATGGWRESALIKLSSAGFDFPGIPLATSDDAIKRIDIMSHALQHNDDAFDTVAYFGDGEWDRVACEELGWTFRPVGPAVNGLSSFHDVLTEFDI